MDRPSPQLNGRRLRQVAVGLWVGLALVSALGPRVVGPPLPIIAALALLPWLWLGMGAAQAVWAWRLRSRGLGALALLSLLFLGAQWGPAWSSRPVARTGVDLRVLSWNVQRLGWSEDPDAPAARCIVEQVERLRPDVLALTEVSAEDVERLSERLGIRCAHADYRGTGEPTVGGLAACARGDRWALGENSPRRFGDSIDWYYVFAEVVPVGGGPVFNLLTVHLQPHGQRPTQPGEVVEDHQTETRALIERMQRLRDPTLLAGDFNSTRDAAIHTRLRRHLVDTFERAGWGPGWTVLVGELLPLRVDYIYATPDFGVRSAHVLPVDCSDHRPVLTDLSLEPRADGGGAP